MRKLSPEDAPAYGPGRFSSDTLDTIMFPGYQWFILEPEVDFPRNESRERLRKRLYTAARRRGGRVTVKFDPGGAVLAYATGCGTWRKSPREWEAEAGLSPEQAAKLRESGGIV